MENFELSEMIKFATDAHEGQVRKGSGLPYIMHPLDVMTILRDSGVTDLVTLGAAVGHDLIEDTDMTSGEIEYEFGFDVTWTIEAVTREGRMNDRDVVNKIKSPIFESVAAEAMQIKMADRLSNLKHMPSDWKNAKMAAYANGGLIFAGMFRDASPTLSLRLMDRCRKIVRLCSDLSKN